MNILILGDGPDELAWAYAVVEHPEHRLEAACPGFKSLPDVPGGNDLDAALARPRRGRRDLREGTLRSVPRGSAAPPPPGCGPSLCIRPDRTRTRITRSRSSRQENGAIVVPDLPGRLHPGMPVLAKAAAEPGTRPIRCELTVEPHDGDLVGGIFPRAVDAGARPRRRGPGDHHHRHPARRAPQAGPDRPARRFRAVVTPRSASTSAPASPRG